MPQRKFPRTKAFFRRTGKRINLLWVLNRKSPAEKLILKKGGILDPIEIKGKAGPVQPLLFFKSRGIHGYSIVLDGKKYVFLVNRLEDTIIRDTICIEQEGKTKRPYFVMTDLQGVKHILETTFPRISVKEKKRILDHFLTG